MTEKPRYFVFKRNTVWDMWELLLATEDRQEAHYLRKAKGGHVLVVKYIEG